jgi:hypothetical protein
MSGGIEGLYEQFQRERDGLRDLHRKLQAISVTAESARREISVRVDHAGVVKDIAFPTNAYRRLAPQELTNLLLQTIGRAREDALTRAAELLTPLLPAGVLPTGVRTVDVVRGDLGLNALIPADPYLPDIVAEQLRR